MPWAGWLCPRLCNLWRCERGCCGCAMLSVRCPRLPGGGLLCAGRLNQSVVPVVLCGTAKATPRLRLVASRQGSTSGVAAHPRSTRPVDPGPHPALVRELRVAARFGALFHIHRYRGQHNRSVWPWCICNIRVSTSTTRVQRATAEGVVPRAIEPFSWVAYTYPQLTPLSLLWAASSCFAIGLACIINRTLTTSSSGGACTTTSTPVCASTRSQGSWSGACMREQERRGTTGVRVAFLVSLACLPVRCTPWGADPKVSKQNRIDRHRWFIERRTTGTTDTAAPTTSRPRPRPSRTGNWGFPRCKEKTHTARRGGLTPSHAAPRGW